MPLLIDAPPRPPPAPLGSCRWDELIGTESTQSAEDAADVRIRNYMRCWSGSRFLCPMMASVCCLAAPINAAMLWPFVVWHVGCLLAGGRAGGPQQLPVRLTSFPSCCLQLSTRMPAYLLLRAPAWFGPVALAVARFQCKHFSDGLVLNTGAGGPCSSAGPCQGAWLHR